MEPNSSATLKTNSGVSHPAVSNGLIGHLTMKVDNVPCKKKIKLKNIY